MRLKIEVASILCIVAVLAKTCLEKFTPKVRRISYNFTSGKNSRKLLDVSKNIFLSKGSFDISLYSAKICQFWSFDPFQRER